MTSPSILKVRRAHLEARIEEMISLLDLIDGDENLEDGGDAEPEETDQDGDELDCSHSEDEWSPYVGGSLEYDGSGVDIANALVKGLPTFYDRATFKEMIANGLDPNRSEIERMRR